MVSVRVVRELIRVVERSAVSRDRFVQAVQLDPGDGEGAEARLPREEVLKLCETAMALTEDEALGIHWGERIAAGAFSVLTHLIEHAATLREAFDTMFKFAKLMTDELPFEVIEQGERVIIQYSVPAEQTARVQRFWTEIVAVSCFRMVRHFSSDASECVASFNYSPPSYREEYTRVFAGAERFNEPSAGLSFRRSMMDAVSRVRDEDLFVALSEIAERRLMRFKQREPYMLRVRNTLMQYPAPHRVVMAQIARKLGLSPRSLYRRLLEEGVSFTEVATEASARVAKRLLADEQLSVQETAYRMGFANPSSFHRAFRRWTGTTPGSFLEQL